MAAPTFTITVSTAPTVMEPAQVRARINTGSVNTGDGSSLRDCMIYWAVTARGSSDLADWPNRMKQTMDRRPSTTIEFAGTAIPVMVDLRGSLTPGYQRSRINGFGWVWYMPAGEWTVHGTMVNPSGEPTTVTADVDVLVDNRTTVTLGNPGSGRDYDDWDPAIQFIDGRADHKLVIDNDFDGEGVDGIIDVSNVLIQAADPEQPSGSLPRVTHSNVDGFTASMFDLRNGTTGCVVDGIDVVPTARSAANLTVACRARGSGNGYINVHVLGDPFTGSAYFGESFLADAINQQIDGFLALNCSSAGSRGTGNYTLGQAGNFDLYDHAIIGGVHKGSFNESIYRVTTNGRSYHRLLAYAELDNSDVQSKSTCRTGYGDYGTYIGLRAIDGSFIVGATSEGLGTNADPELVPERSFVIVDGVYSTGVATEGPNIGIRNSCSDVVIRNGYAGLGGITIASGVANGKCQRNVAYNCTSEGDIQTGGNAAGTYNGMEIRQSYAAGKIAARTGVALAGGIDQNQAGSFEIDDVAVDLSVWNADLMVGADTLGTVTLGDDFSSESLPKYAPLGANPHDIWHRPRGTLSSIGASGEGVMVPSTERRGMAGGRSRSRTRRFARRGSR